VWLASLLGGFAQKMFEHQSKYTAKNHISKNQGWKPRRVAPRQHLSISLNVKIGGEGGILSLREQYPRWIFCSCGALQKMLIEASNPSRKQFKIAFSSPHFTSLRSEREGFFLYENSIPDGFFVRAEHSKKCSSRLRIPHESNLRLLSPLLTSLRYVRRGRDSFSTRTVSPMDFLFVRSTPKNAHRGFESLTKAI